MLKSEISRGLIYSGSTPFNSSLRVEQTGPLQLTVRKGTFTWVDGTEVILKEDQVADLNPHPTYPKEAELDLIHSASGEVDVLLRTRLLDGPWPEAPEGWELVHALVFPFGLPPACADLAPLSMYVLKVEPGFPPGTTAADWGPTREAEVEA